MTVIRYIGQLADPKSGHGPDTVGELFESLTHAEEALKERFASGSAFRQASILPHGVKKSFFYTPLTKDATIRLWLLPQPLNLEALQRGSLDEVDLASFANIPHMYRVRITRTGGAKAERKGVRE